MSTDKVYGIADRAWQFVIGCDPHMSCAPRCWARRTMARVVACQIAQNNSTGYYFGGTLSEDLRQWSGTVTLDRVHLSDPLKWRKPALIASGFHGDWARLTDSEKYDLFRVIDQCDRHTFMLLTKMPELIAPVPCTFPNVTLGCSVMNQSEADRMRPAMAELSRLGWRTHVWYEPAIGPVDWSGWEFIEQIIVGGESGPGARPFDLAWARATRDWARTAGVAFWLKQLGVWPYDAWNHDPVKPLQLRDRGRKIQPFLDLKDRKGGDIAEFPEDLRVREMPEARV